MDVLESLNKLILSPTVSKYRRGLLIAAVMLLSLHLTAFVLPFLLEARWVDHLVTSANNFLGVTQALVIVVVLAAALRALGDVDRGRRFEVYCFLEKELRTWFEASPPLSDLGPVEMEGVVSCSLTHFQVVGPAARQDRDGDDVVLQRFCRDVHFELTFYPTKVVYGLHFENADRSVNERMAAAVREVLGLEDTSGFGVDREIPKKPAWVFLVRKAPLSGDFERDTAELTTHARHFIELVGHSFDLIYSTPMANRYRALVRPSHVELAEPQ